MNEEMEKCAEESRAERLKMATIRGDATRLTTNPQALLDIAKKIQEFVDFNQWSWCDMEKVYRILKTIHG